ncbi:unnamed protein product [Protopolystoma xenopodis]|uniref:Uncharacterized protein n=1 Tax=Protopolystoma xenopodis TaxID=117903 RepID=A0A3S5FG14_9PLAT|nr:unnamed protein product [Protopolystoma xenopodis]
MVDVYTRPQVQSAFELHHSADSSDWTGDLLAPDNHDNTSHGYCRSCCCPTLETHHQSSPLPREHYRATAFPEVFSPDSVKSFHWQCMTPSNSCTVPVSTPIPTMTTKDHTFSMVTQSRASGDQQTCCQTHGGEEHLMYRSSQPTPVAWFPWAQELTHTPLCHQPGYDICSLGQMMSDTRFLQCNENIESLNIRTQYALEGYSNQAEEEVGDEEGCEEEEDEGEEEDEEEEEEEGLHESENSDESDEGSGYDKEDEDEGGKKQDDKVISMGSGQTVEKYRRDPEKQSAMHVYCSSYLSSSCHSLTSSIIPTLFNHPDSYYCCSSFANLVSTLPGFPCHHPPLSSPPIHTKGTDELQEKTFSVNHPQLPYESSSFCITASSTQPGNQMVSSIESPGSLYSLASAAGPSEVNLDADEERSVHLRYRPNSPQRCCGERQAKRKTAVAPATKVAECSGQLATSKEARTRNEMERNGLACETAVRVIEAVKLASGVEPDPTSKFTIDQVSSVLS